MSETSRAARVALWVIVTAHLLLLAVTLPDYRVSIDSGYHVSLGRHYAEHGPAFWDPINWGPRGRPNLQGPLMHIGIAVIGSVLGGSGNAFVLANAILALSQWVAAVLTVIFFARRCVGDWTALFAIALFTGSGLASMAFYVGLPSGWIFIFTPWAIWFFIEGRWPMAALLVAAACYVHLGGYATAPVGILVAALLLRRWKHLVFVGATSVVLTLPYTLHFLRYRDWYIGERGHVALGLATPLIYLFAIPGLVMLMRQPRRNVLLVAWAIAPISWLFQDSQRFSLQSTLAGSVIAGVFLRFVCSRVGHPLWRNAFAVTVLVVANVYPLSTPGFLSETRWAIGLRYPRMLEWGEAKKLAAIIHERRLDRRLVYVYNHSFSPALAVYQPMTFERGHWVEVQPHPNPANQLSAGIKTYVLPIPPDDAVLGMFEREQLLVVHGGTGKTSVITLTRPGDLPRVARLVSRTASADAHWLADHAVNNKLEPIGDLFSTKMIEARRAQRREQRIHADRIALAALVYAYALEPKYPRYAEGSRDSVRAFSSIAAFLSDEWSVDFQSDERHERFRENVRRFGDAVAKLGDRLVPFVELDQASDLLFDDYFWAA